MKKIIIGALALVTIVASGLFIKTQTVDATVFTPVINLDVTKADDKIESYINHEFEVDVTITPEDMEYVNTAPVTSNTIEDVYLQVKEQPGLDFKGVKIGEKFLPVEVNRVKLPNIEYKDVAGDPVWSTKADPINIKLVFEGTVSQVFNGVGDISLFYDENERKPDAGQGKAALSPNAKPIVKVGTLAYEGGQIKGLGINDSLTDHPQDAPLTMPLNRYFDLNYLIKPGTLVGTMPGGGESRAVGFDEERNLIYVVDKAVIDLVGSNDESTRASIKNALTELKQTNPNSTTSLIVYGESAEITKVDDKDVFSIDALINQIDLIESEEKDGNLGDALRNAQILSSKTELEDSIVVVSGGNPSYYTQVSEGNSAMLATTAEKEGFVVEDKELAKDYIQTVVDNIIADEKNSTRWYGVNYGISNEETFLNDMLENLDGETTKVLKPYTSDFIDVNNKAVSPLSIKGTLTVESINPSIEIHPDDVEKEINLQFEKVVGVDGATTLKPIEQKVTARAKIINVHHQNEALGFDVADAGLGAIEDAEKSGTIKTTLEVEHNGKVHSYVFNDPMKPEAKPLKTWWVVPEVPYVANLGLFNGRMQLPVDILKGTVEDIQEVDATSNAVLDELEDADLAVENSFGFGMVIKTKNPQTLKPVLKIGGAEKEITTGYKLYKVVDGKLINQSDTKTLEVGSLYVVVIDHYIDGSVGQSVGDMFEVGVNITDGAAPAISEENTDGETSTQTTTSGGAFWGIEVNVVDKPEHF
ncbi:MAG: vWA domain-containing protein [Sarcina sp.]